MTIPLKVVIPLLLLIPLAIWFSGIRRYDFMTPRNIPESELRPDFASPVDRGIADLLAESRASTVKEEPPEIPEIETGDFRTSPGLDEYRASSELGAPALFNLAERLQSAGQAQRALLAYERILDSTPNGSSTQQEAEAALANLKEVIPTWNSDPSAAAPLLIHLDTSRSPESLSAAIGTLTELVRVGSGNQSKPEFIIQNSPPPSQELPSRPVAIWLTVPEEEPEKPSLATITVTPQSDEELDSQLTHGLYRLLSRRIESIAQLTPPPALLQGEDPENALVNKITRLAWNQILSTPFQSLEAGPPDDVLTTDSPDSPAAEPEEDVSEEAQEQE